MRQSAGTAEPAPSSTMSPGTKNLASMFCQEPSRLTVAVGLSEALSAATASAALMVSYLFGSGAAAAAAAGLSKALTIQGGEQRPDFVLWDYLAGTHTRCA
jgi:hypothetical protein